jgi:hypothetical protein
MTLSLSIIAIGLFTGFFRHLSLGGRLQFYACAPRFGKPNGNRLFRRTRAMFALTNMMHFLPYKFSRLGAGGLAFASILLGAFNGFLFRHEQPPDKYSNGAPAQEESNIFCSPCGRMP